MNLIKYTNENQPDGTKRVIVKLANGNIIHGYFNTGFKGWYEVSTGNVYIVTNKDEWAYVEDIKEDAC